MTAKAFGSRQGRGGLSWLALKVATLTFAHMTRHRLHRQTTAFFVVLSLLFSQLALASHVCPQQADPAAVAAVMEAGTHCDGMAPQQLAQCHQHAVERRLGAGSSYT